MGRGLLTPFPFFLKCQHPSHLRELNHHHRIIKINRYKYVFRNMEKGFYSSIDGQVE